MSKLRMLLIVTLAGCAQNTLPLDEDSIEADEAAHKADHYSCVLRGKRCKVGGTKCCTGFCNDTGYSWGYCSAPLADGAFCQADSQCKSKTCKNYTCVAPAPACAADNQVCLNSSQCCSGYCEIGYIQGRCAPPQPAGAWCTADSECQSKVCYNYQCAAPGCSADKASCWSSSSCCSGFCNWVAYAKGECAPPQAAGAYCLEASECLSRVCTDYQCQ